MNFSPVIRISFAAFLLFFWTTTWADINDTATERRLSLPGSEHGLSIPRDDWTISKEQRRPGDTAVYYMFTSERRRMAFSVYIDKTDVCQSADACLESSLKNPQYKGAQELRISNDREFKFATFFLDQPQGAPVKQSHMVASALVGGQWIDVHISQTAKERPEIAPLLDFLKIVVIK